MSNNPDARTPTTGKRQAVQYVLLAILVCVLIVMVVIPLNMRRDFQATRTRIEALLESGTAEAPTRWNELEKLLGEAAERKSRVVNNSMFHVERVETASWNAYFTSWHLRFGIGRDDIVLSWDEEDDIGREPTPLLYALDEQGGLKKQIDLSSEEERRVSTDEWIERLDRIAEGPQPERAARILILPSVDSDGRMTDDGLVLCDLAQFHLAEVATPRIAVHPSIARIELDRHDLGETLLHLDDDIARVVGQASSSDLTVLPILDVVDGAAQLRVRGFQPGEEPVESAVIAFIADERHRLPELVAREAVALAGMTLSDEAEKQLSRRHVSDADGLKRMVELYRSGVVRFQFRPIQHFLADYPECMPVWLSLAGVISQQRDALTLLLGDERASQHPVVASELAIALGRIDRKEHALQILLEHSAGEVDSPVFFQTAAELARQLDDDDLLAAVLKHWQEIGTTSVHRNRQGMTFHDMGWDGLRTEIVDFDSALDVVLFRQHLKSAQERLEQAVEANPLDWHSRSLLISVARGLGLPREFVDQHWRDAVEVWPYSSYPWKNSLDYLSKRWHGDTESLLAFGRECVDSKQWHGRVPMLAHKAVSMACRNPFDNSFDDSLLYRPDVWSILKDVYIQSREQDAGQDHMMALSWVFSAGPYVEDWDTLSLAFEELDSLDVTDIDLQKGFVLPTALARARDRVTASLGAGAKAQLAQARLALMAGRADECDDILDSIDEQLNNTDAAMHAWLKRVIKLERSLQDAGRVKLTARDILDTFCEVGRTQITPLTEARGWEVVDGRAIFKDPDPGPPNVYRAYTRTIALPLGLTNVRIHGDLPVSDGTDAVIYVHAFARRDTIHCRLDYFQRNVVVKMNQGVLATQRNDGHTIRSTALIPDGPFVFEKGHEEDVIQFGSNEWRMPVNRDVPSGLAIRFNSAVQGGTYALPDLTIEILN